MKRGALRAAQRRFEHLSRKTTTRWRSHVHTLTPDHIHCASRRRDTSWQNPNANSHTTRPLSISTPTRLFSSYTTPSENVEAHIRKTASIRATSVTLNQMYEFGKSLDEEKLMQISLFVWKEIPIRISHRITELNNLPYGLSNTPSVKKLRGQYINQFIKFKSFPKPDTVDYDNDFTELLAEHLQTMANAVPLMANGVQEMAVRNPNMDIGECPFLNDFLDKFYMSRIGTRVITGQHVALHRKTPPSWVGMIDGECSARQVGERAYDDARQLCERMYGMAPALEIRDPCDVCFRYIADHLHHMVFELMKNSMRATCEKNCDKDEEDLPPIKMIVVPGETEITIKIADEGGGIPRGEINKIFLYSYTTADRPDFDEDIQTLSTAPLAGFGYGLPISRLYARYFGGDLQIISMDGYGTDAYLYLNKLGDNHEPLPYPFDNLLEQGKKMFYEPPSKSGSFGVV